MSETQEGSDAEMWAAEDEAAAARAEEERAAAGAPGESGGEGPHSAPDGEGARSATEPDTPGATAAELAAATEPKADRKPTPYVVQEEVTVALGDHAGEATPAWVVIGEVEGMGRAEAREKALAIARTTQAAQRVGAEGERTPEKVGRLQLTPTASWKPSKPKVEMTPHLTWEDD